MSVLYKALQKAAKENEERQAAAPAAFDAERLAGSGVIRAGGAGRAKWRVASIAFLVVSAALMGAAFYFTSIAPMNEPQVAVVPPPRPRPAPPAAEPTPAAQAPVAAAQAPSAPPAQAPAMPAAAAPSAAQATPAPAQAPAVAAAPAPTAAPAAAPAVASAPPAAPAAAVQTAASTSAAPTPAPAAPAAPVQVAEAPAPAAEAPAKPAAKAATPKTVSTREPMPKLPADSPARMLDPPINVRRAEIELEGVGNAVRVRTVSQAAQNTVGAAYSALVRGEYAAALDFYDRALKQEPTSVLALLGRGAALQKLGRKDEARIAYDLALKIDPQNREALSNLTSIESERAPADALVRLVNLEREYPNFSPIKAQIGLAYARMDNLEGALDYLRRAVAITPNAALYQYNIALVLDRMGSREQAVEAYEQVLASMSGGRALPEISIADIQRRLNFLRAK